MTKHLFTAAAALALASFAFASAQAGGATSAASKYNGAASWTGSDQFAQTDKVKITEFSSSSTKVPVSKR